MNGLPLHPAIVHVPLGVAVVIPLLAAGFAWAIWKGKLPKKAWLAVLIAQTIVVGAAVVALRTGEADEERVEDRVGESRIEEHEERAEAFTWTAAAVLLVAAAGYAVRTARPSNALMAGAAAGSIAVLALGLSVGHAGGQLVHGPNGLTGTTGAAANEASEHGEDDEAAEAGEARPANQGGGATAAGRRGHEEREGHEDDDD